jgi:hypothetical protein
MSTTTRPKKNRVARTQAHMPTNSVFFEKVVPILLGLMGLLMLALILFAAGVLLGLVHF